jgi:hypothetical protein
VRPDPGIDAAARLQALGLAGPLSIERWIFDVGIARLTPPLASSAPNSPPFPP